MNLRASLPCVGLSILLSGAGSAQVLELPGATEDLGGFALRDASGARLLLTSSLTQPELLKTVLCSDGQRVRVQFARRQTDREGHDGRQTAGNFDSLAGSAFTVVTGRIEPDAICFLASDALLAGSVVLSVAAPQGAGACLERGRFTRLRDRGVTHCWPIARVGAAKQVALVEFERRGNDALASLVFADGARAVFADYPAEFRGPGQDLWRADDGGVLSPRGLRVVCAVQRGDSYTLGVAWPGAEGVSLALWRSQGRDRFTMVLSEYWYQAPK